MRNRLPRCCLVLVLLAGAALVPAPSAAQQGAGQGPTAADRETARALLLDGRKKLAAGNAQGALKDFQAAHAIMKVPTTGLDLAKAQEKLGMLIEARATALDVTRIPATDGESPAFATARTEAEKLAEALAGRIPSVSVRVKGPPAGATPSVKVDGAAVPAAAVDAPRKVNPGQHEIEASAPGFAAARQSVTVKERETLPVELTLSPDGSAAAAGPSPGPADATGAAGPDVAGGRDVPAWAWVAGGVGVVALGVGVVFMVDYASVRSTIADDCPNDVCAGEYDDAEVDSLRSRWNRDLGLAVGLGAVGLAGIGVAIYGIVTAQGGDPSDAGETAARSMAVSPWVSPGGAGAWVSGRF